jgi:membrane protein YdbS with pleckstrin-like domain
VGYIDRSLVEGERVLYRARLHWVVLFWPILVASAIGALGVAFLVVVVVPSLRPHGFSAALGVAGLLLFLGALALIGSAMVARNATEIAVTSRRVLIKTGIVNRRTLELLLVRIESIGVNEPPLGRMLGFGTVVLRGTGGTPEQFDRIANPLEFRKQVQSQVEGVLAAVTR